MRSDERNKEFYRDEIIKMVKIVESSSVLRYIYIIIRDIVKELKL